MTKYVKKEEKIFLLNILISKIKKKAKSKVIKN